MLSEKSTEIPYVYIFMNRFIFEIIILCEFSYESNY